ncbi:TrbI/VirB10 family protein [Labrenzia sp. DG1229]|uniref:TrbI/VirB10 family protein n=1 Tax=Labrenzia sp. DG1229 TaxID=681847 RepID=UPI00048F9371|nr:TrbI/VirB10 family protein [Labrenzia sp. DG1229]
MTQEAIGSTPKLDPEDLALRARPKPVKQVNRRLLILLSGSCLVLISSAVFIALDPPELLKRVKTGNELYRTENHAKPDGLEQLPESYGDLKPKIELGPPLPGDLGAGFARAERDLGIESAPALPFRPDPEADAARAERIRLARLAQQGRESDVFFQLNTKASGNGNLEGLGIALDRPGRIATNRSPLPRASILSAGVPARPIEIDAVPDQNRQLHKQAFLNAEVDGAIYSSHTLQDPVSPYQLMAGTIISASLLTGLNSDLPGKVIAQVTSNVFDTATGQHLLVPQGSRLIGSYDSQVSFGQDRVLIVWHRIIMPDGASVVIDNLPATDAAGYAGLKDKVDFHTWRLLKGIALSTLLGAGTELTFGEDESDLVKALRSSLQDNANQVGQSLTARNLNIQPTITIRPGWPLRIIVQKDMVLRPYGQMGAAR